jgi:hypothetical protein
MRWPVIIAALLLIWPMGMILLITKIIGIVKKNREEKILSDPTVPFAEFKTAAERKDKEALIEGTFYMLSDEDKADVVANIDKYSLEDIEAKLSIICVRNKVSFNLDDENKGKDPMVYNLHDHDNTETIPAWVQAALNTAKTLN